jgi:predicted Zn-dependent peptidase
MVFKGTEKYPTTEDVNVIERAGGLQNAYTDIDVTNYHNKVLAEDWELGLDINKELALHPRLEERWVDKERDVIIEEMKRYDDEPAAKVEETFHHMMYKGTRLGMRIIGEEASLRSVASKELQTYHSSWYAPEKMVVILAGNIDDARAKSIQEKVTEWFGTLDSKPQGDIEQVKDSQSAPQLEVVTKPDAQQAHMIIGLRTFARGSEDRFAWNIFNLLMGVGFTSRLFKEVREKRGLCYHVRSDSSGFTEVGYWDIYAGVGTAKVEETTKAIMDELKKAVDKGVTDDEIMVAKKRLKTVIAFRSEDPEFFTEWYGRQEVYGQPLMTLEDYLQKIESVSKQDIDMLIRKYFKTESLNMALVWNKPKDENLLKLLSF